MRMGHGQDTHRPEYTLQQPEGEGVDARAAIEAVETGETGETERVEKVEREAIVLFFGPGPFIYVLSSPT